MHIARCAAYLLLGAVCVANISRAADEVPTGKLPAGVAPLKYSLDLRIDPHAARFSGRARIHVQLDQATDHIWLHAKNLKVAHAELIDAAGKSMPVTFAMRDASGVAKVTFPRTLAAQQADLVFAYSAPFNVDAEGIYKVKVGTDDYVVSQMEAISARFAFPGFDEPRFKTPFDITMTVPRAQTAFSNTRVLSEKASADGKWKTVSFATTKPLPTYLIAFAVGPWDVAQATDIAPNGIRTTPLPLRAIGPRGTAPQLKWILEQTPGIVNYYEQYTQQPFPFDKLDLLGVPNFAASGMENAGLIMFDDALLRFGADSPLSAYVEGYTTVAHEIAHQWFGDLVTMPWWDDLWLNESFANWAQYKAVIALKPEFAGQMARADDALGAMDSDSLLSARKIRQPIVVRDDIDNAFDGITYLKGAALLRMIEAWVGEDVYRDALRDYFAQRTFGSGSTADLIAAIAKHSGKGEVLAQTMRSFLDQPGVPSIHTALRCEGGTAQLSLSQSRYLPYGSIDKDRSQWTMPVCVRLGFADTSMTQCVVLDQPEQKFALSGGCAGWYTPNAGADGYYRAAIDEKDLAVLAGRYDSLQPLEQKYYVDSVAAGFRRGDLAPATLLETLSRSAHSEQPQIATGLVAWFEWIRDYLADGTTRPALDAFADKTFAPRLQSLGYRRRADDSVATTALRLSIAQFLAQTIRDSGVRAALAEQGRDALGLGMHPGVDLKRADPDLCGLALEVAVQESGAPAFDAAMTELKSNRQTLERSELLNALGATRDAKLAERARNYGLSTSVQVGEMSTIFSAQVAQAENRPAFWNWFKLHFEAIHARAPDEFVGMDIVSVNRCSTAEADELVAWFTPRLKELIGGEHSLAITREQIEQCSALRQHLSAGGGLAAWVQSQAAGSH